MTITEPSPAGLPAPWQRYLLATRPPFLVASLVPVLIGWASALHAGSTFNPWSAALTLLGALTAHAGINVLNDYYDHRNGTDAANTDRLFPYTGGSRFIQNGVFTPAQTARYGALLLAAAALIGLALVPYVGAPLLPIGACGLLLGWGYSAPPLRLNSRGLGEPGVALGFGILIPLGADAVQRGEPALAPVYAGLAYACLVANVLYINQFPDRRADAACGKLHWVARLGARRARWGYLALAGAAASTLAAAVMAARLPTLALLAAAPLLLSLIAARDLLAFAEQPHRLRRAIRATLAAAFLHGLVLAGALVLVRP